MLYVYDGNQEEPEQYVVLNGQEEGRDVSEFDAWVAARHDRSPRQGPSTTTATGVGRCAPRGQGRAERRARCDADARHRPG